MSLPSPDTNPNSAFNGAGASIDAQKMAMLQSIAQQGSAAQAQFQQQQDQNAQLRALALTAAQVRANGISAPVAATVKLQQGVQDLGNIYQNDAQMGATAAAAEQSRLTTANGQYMDQIKAAIPIAEAASQARIREAQIKADNERALQEAQIAAANASRAASDAPSPLLAGQLRLQELQIAAEEKAAKGEASVESLYSAPEAAKKMGWIPADGGTIRKGKVDPKTHLTTYSGAKGYGDILTSAMNDPLYADAISAIQTGLVANLSPQEILRQLQNRASSLGIKSGLGAAMNLAAVQYGLVGGNAGGGV